ncbi:hypothetical protein AXY43_05070 [Clostridium sp. MF28]|uniref:MarR family transcriptional regulator n=1 Tax=Clostridium TaxID=1485 RepID=UPI000CF8C990|nr:MULTISPECIES: MarR family transcriptional regulator [Clostridium]AVK47446.1 hypothetical protein AXY43_05070 [Clostridium sp. MF28]NOW82724.1 DNA-binding MarR family transcriptional regulator [Clostridium beijerinckii]PSM57195.1 hypothetical protein C4L39_13330 [Clostridium diolis]
MDNFSIILDEMIGRMFFISGELEKRPKDYGNCGVPLHMSDIHMIEAIQKNQSANTTEIAKIMNTTKSTVSKITKRLEKEGMIKKYKFLDNKKEIYFKLTDLGLKAFNGHYEYHISRTQSFDKEFDNYTEEEKKLIVNFLKKYTEELEQYLK